MTRCVFVAGPNIQHRYGALYQTRGQIGAAERFEGLFTAGKVVQDTLYLRQVPLGNDAK